MAKRRKTSQPESTPKQGSDIPRGPGGRFPPGVSGNPGGRPKAADEIVELARTDSPEAYEKVARIMRDDDHRQQLTAALAILKVAGVLRASETVDPNKPVTPGSVATLPDEALDAALAPGTVN